MEELIFGSLIVWALGRVLKKKADQPAPGTIDLPRQRRTQQMINPDPHGNPSAPASGQIVTGGPQGKGALPGSGGYNSSTLKKFV